MDETDEDRPEIAGTAPPPIEPVSWPVMLLRQAGGALVVALTVSLALFAAVRSLPGDPVALRLKHPDPVRVAELRAELGLDAPSWVQYGRYVRRFLTGDWGNSLVTGRPVVDELGAALTATLELSVVALALGALFGVGMVLAGRAIGGGVGRTLARMLGAAGLTVPVFVLGLLLLGFVGWVGAPFGGDGWPTGGRWDWTAGTPPTGTGFLLWDALMTGRPGDFTVAMRHLLLPAIALAWYPAALVAGTLEARLEDPRWELLRRSLRARGYSPARIWLVHLLRLVGAPIVTVLGTNFGGLLGGAVMTETVFSWPGVGRYLVQAVLGRDVFVIENGLLAIVLLALTVTLLSDAAAGWLSPVRAGTERRHG